MENCEKQKKLLYKNKDGTFKRKAPPYNATDCKDEIKIGNNGEQYRSIKNDKGKYRWIKIKSTKVKKSSTKVKKSSTKVKKSSKKLNLPQNIWSNYDETLFYKLNIGSLKNTNCCFDYDDTLAYLRTSNPMPNVIDTLRQLSLKNNIIIFTNQKGVSSGKSTNEQVQSIIDKFCEKINIPISIFYSITDDKYRKPMSGMFNFAKNIFKKTKFKYYCGDAAGRLNDFSVSDLYFANNNKIKFMTPEEVFNNKKKMNLATKKIKDLYKEDVWINGILSNKRSILEYYNLKDLDKKLPILDVNKYKYLIINIGPQGSGKSTLSKYLSEKYDFGIISRDKLKTKSNMNKSFLNFKNSKKGIIIDNTNPTKKNRNLWINKLKNDNWKIIKIHIDIPKLLSFHLTRYRMFFGGSKIPSVAIHSYYKKLESDENCIVLDKAIIDHKFNHNLRFVWR